MAYTFDSGNALAVGTSEITMITCPVATQIIVIGYTIANITAGNVKVSIKFGDSSASTESHIIKNGDIAPGSSLVPIGGFQRIVLNAGDTIKVVSDTDASVDATISYIELT